jgi:glycosyltransferase involved in cell wall biosynthesis
MAAEALAAKIVPKRKVQVIFNGIDLEQFRQVGDPAALRASLGIPADAPVIGTTGRLNEIKRQDVLIHGFALLRDKVPNARLVLVGEGDLREELTALVESLGIREFVHFAGYTAQPQFYHHMFDVFALTSRAEGTPQSVIEAGVACKPVISSRVGGVPELVEDGETGLLFPAGDAQALADGLFKLLNDRDYAQRLAKAGQRRVESRYDIKRMVDDYHRDYLELLGNRRKVL